jgi:hypothetical protein
MDSGLKKPVTVIEKLPNRYVISLGSADGEIVARVSVLRPSRDDPRGAEEKKAEALQKAKALARALYDAI